MSRRPLLGAVAGLLALALGTALAPASHAAAEQASCPAATDADSQNLLQFEAIDLHDASPSADPHQPIEFRITNNGSSIGPRGPEVNEITATIVGCKDGQQLPDPTSAHVDQGTSNSMDLAWAADFTWNGEYDVVIDAKGRRPSGLTYTNQSLHVVKRVHLAVPPQKPTGVKASTANGVVTITWSNTGREPDLIAYEVRRAKQGTNDYVTVKDGLVQPTVSSVSDLPGEGAYRYQVIAYRPDVEAGTASSDATAEITAVAPGETTGSGSGAGGTGGGASTSGGGGAGTSATSTTLPKITTGGAGGTVDLSHFAAALNARRSTPTTRVEPPDPGYQETLPFHVGGSGDDPAVGSALGAKDDQGLGERLVSDPDARRRSLGFVAFGLLLFVLGMTGLFVKGEVNRADALETVDDADDVEPLADVAPVEPDGALAAAVVPEVETATAAAVRRRRRSTATSPDAVAEVEPESTPVEVRGPAGAVVELPERRNRRPRRLALLGPDPAELDEFTPPEAAASADEDLRDVLGEPQPAPVVHGGHRRRPTVAPLDAPGLDVPDPVPASATTSRTATHARRAPSRLPARPADDRRQGRAALRAGGGGTGEGDRRVPVGR